MKKQIMLILLISLSNLTIAQFYFEIGAGNASYKVGNHKEINNDFIKSSPVDLKLVDNFPNRPFLFTNLTYKYTALEISSFIGQNSTSSKLHYKDYSGEISLIQQLKATSFGFVGKVYLIDKKVGWNIGAGFSAAKTRLNVKENIQVFEEKAHEKYMFESSELRYNLCSELTYNVNIFRFTFLLAKEKTMKASPFEWTEEPDATFEDSRGNAYKPDWSGYRIGIKVGINFSKLAELDV